MPIKYLSPEEELRLKQNRVITFSLFLITFVILPIFSTTIKPIKLIYSNGLIVKYFKIKDMNYSKIIIKINSGDATIKNSYGGITEITIDSLFRGCKGYSEETVKTKILSDGVLIRKKISSEGVFLIFSLPTENILNFLKILTSCLSSPNMYLKSISKAKKSLLLKLSTDKQKIIPLLKKNILFFLFGENHPYGKKISYQGTRSLTEKQVKKFYKTYIVPSNIEFVILSNFPKDKIKNSIVLSGWKRKPVFRISVPQINKKSDDVFVRIKNNKKAYIIYSVILPGFFKVKRYKLEFLTHLFGGYFGSRANIFFSERGYKSPEIYRQFLSEYSVLALIFEVSKEDVANMINMLNKFILRMDKDFPTGIEIKDGITSFIGKKFLQWQRLDQYYIDYLYNYKSETTRNFTLKDLLLKIKKSEIKRLYKQFKNRSVIIIAGDDSVRKQLKGFYRVYSMNDF